MLIILNILTFLLRIALINFNAFDFVLYFNYRFYFNLIEIFEKLRYSFFNNKQIFSQDYFDF